MAELQRTIDTAASLAAVGKYDEAAELLDSLPPDGGGGAQALLLRARIAAQRGRFDEAESVCRQIDRLAPQGATATEVGELRAALRAVRERSPAARRLSKLLAGVAIAVFCLIAGAAYLAGHRSGVFDAHSQGLNSLGQQQTSLNEDVQRQDRGLRELMESVGQLRQSLTRIEEQQKQGQRSLDRRIQQIDKSLRSISEQFHGSASDPPAK